MQNAFRPFSDAIEKSRTTIRRTSHEDTVTRFASFGAQPMAVDVERDEDRRSHVILNELAT